MRLKIWWLPAPPSKAFHREVATVEEGHALLNALVDYTRYLEGRGLLQEYDADVGGVQAWEDGEWLDAEFVLDDEAVWNYEEVDA